MQYVPSLSPPASMVESWREVQAASATRRARPVQAPAQLLVMHPHSHAAVEQLAEVDRRGPGHESRRKACRRIRHQPMLEELRSGVDRRHHQQRGDDEAEHIDEKV